MPPPPTLPTPGRPLPRPPGPWALGLGLGGGGAVNKLSPNAKRGAVHSHPPSPNIRNTVEGKHQSHVIQKSTKNTLKLCASCGQQSSRARGADPRRSQRVQSSPREALGRHRGDYKTAKESPGGTQGPQKRSKGLSRELQEMAKETQ